MEEQRRKSEGHAEKRIVKLVQALNCKFLDDNGKE
jgi:hypothetical protein